MAILGVNTKCYILALFIRDDNERFLLGSGYYEFKENQMHFSANTVANDVVEVQGNDGYLLAGQVRRPGSQSFDGYVGDGLVDKATTETKRREFFAFFRKNHFYKVVYVFADGTAVQRKRGFLVDDPTVQELYQIYPEYHVALNFEDVNYYTYSENGSGEEIYAQEADVFLTHTTATGGLVWDQYGVVWEDTQWGGIVNVPGATETQINNELDVQVPVDNVEVKGDTYQQTYSGKNLLPIPDGTVTSQGVTWTRDNGVIRGVGTLTNVTFSSFVIITNFPQELPAGTYTYSIESSYTYDIEINLRTSDNTRYIYKINAGETSTTFTTDYVAATYSLAISGAVNGAVINTIIPNLQLELGSTATDYEPYVGGIPAPNPDYPQDINVATGEQTVTITDENNQSQSYTIDLGSTELCKIGDYQDYIYKSGNDWYLHKEIGRQTIGGGENWTIQNNTKTNYIYFQTQAYTFTPTNVDTVAPALSTQLIAETGGNANSSDTYPCFAFNTSGYLRVNLSRADFPDRASVKSHFTSNPMDVYYALATPTDVQITDADLIADLKELGTMKLFVGENNLEVTATSANLPGLLGFDYYTSVSTTGAEWEEGGNGGPTIVYIDSIDNVYPIWEVVGPAANPQLSVLTTNTTLSYSGTITANQTLVIDMFNKTAKLNGTSVIGNVSGEWVNFAPGNNRVVYSTNNADAPSSKIYWQEVVG